MNALILAAGLGTRLLPLTTAMPKPLVPVGDKTLLDHQLAALAEADVEQTLVNAHHLAAQVQTAAATRPIAAVFYEEEILGTGGPLARVLAAGYDDDLLVLNGDVLHDVDLKAFVAAAKAVDAPFSLVLVDNPAVNSVGVDATGRVCGVRNVYESDEAASHGTFAGISWYSAETLRRIREDQFSIVGFWREEAAAGRRPTAWRHEGDWFDVGTPAGLYASSYRRLTTLGLPAWGPTTPDWQHCINHGDATSSDQLRDCIIMPGATVPNGDWQRRIFVADLAEPWQC